MELDFWKKFYNLPLEKIPWNQTQMDWFKELIDSGEISGTSAIDLGCGVGMKSIYLAQHVFGRVLGIDITPKAIDYAKANAKKHNTQGVTEFVVHDATDLEFLGEEKFDLVLDWANIHCLPIESRKNYAKQISKHVNPGETKFLLRTFNNKKTDAKSFESDMGGKVYFLSEEDIRDLFEPYFDVVKQNESEPFKLKDYVFDEYLMVAK